MALQRQSQTRAAWLAITALGLVRRALAHPVSALGPGEERSTPVPVGSGQFYVQLVACGILVLAGGLLAGLTLGLMSLDETNLHILATSGSEKQKRYAQRILPIRRNGHWLLVTLLLANTVINETLPIVLHAIVGGGVMAVLVSTAAIVLFGEIIPQSLCARHGLAIGAFFAYPVRMLQYFLAPIGYPIAMLLDYVLGPDHGVIYKKAQLKELVSLSDTAHGGNLSVDEVTIIRGALELGEKRIVEVMTEMKNVYMVDINACLDRVLLTEMLHQGHSRVPVYDGDRENIVGVLLVKSLLLLDPDDSTPMREAKIAPVPLVTPDVPLYDILNAFQEGGSHMAVVVGPRPPRQTEGDSESTPLLSSATTGASLPPPAGDAPTPQVSGSPPQLFRKLSGYILNSNSNNTATAADGTHGTATVGHFGEISHESVQGFVPLGIITLEDVIEELIQEEIIDETDVFVDMRQKIKVMRAVKLAQQSKTVPVPVKHHMPSPNAASESMEVAYSPQRGGKKRGAAFSSRRRT
ncbi:hypothetical protein LPJ61_005694 [Coemansia biformis]|uniref:DUF21-domain-containing protein n=1 Tax=Coemansia biformis TaxID=1286918 RepID=A0A9W7Y663_9FUNG|nr:hypothetical protein LPJ61_005694 [Coemansia biformis]